MTEIPRNPGKHALLVGINEYPLLHKRYQLEGCVNDVELMAHLLQSQFGFPKDNVELVKNASATREGILDALHRLVMRVQQDDVVLLHYSGHGSQMTDREGDEPDGLDETVVPYDSGRAPLPNRDITDDEIYDWLLRLTETTPYVTLIFDCCHSGTIARDAFGEKERWVEPDERLVDELPPSPVAAVATRGLQRDVGPSGWLPLGKRYVLIAGCRDDESAFEYREPEGETVFGALTYFLCQELTQAESGTTYLDIFEQVRARVTAMYPRQQPQMEGVRHRELFGLSSIEPMRFVGVTSRSGNQVKLASGAAQGMTVGSQWSVYPPGTKQVGDGTPQLGLVEITAVRAVTSEGKILEEQATGTIAQGGRAVEEAHHYGQMRLRAQVQAPPGFEDPVRKLSKEIERSPLLQEVEAEAVADARAYLIPERTAAAEGDPVPQLGPTTRPVWVVVGNDGKLLMPVHRVEEPGVAALLRENLEKRTKYRQALQLVNPDRDNPLRGKVDFVLKRMQADGTWAVAKPEQAGGEVVFEEGERIGFQITNNTDAAVYVSVLDFGLTGAIGLLHPIEGASEPLAGGRSIDVGIREGDEIELYMPDDFPYVTDPQEEGPAQGLESFKLFVTSHPANFDVLMQEGMRGRADRGEQKPLEALLDMALTGYGTRDAKRNRRQPDEAWITVTHSFILRRKTPSTRLRTDGQAVAVGGVSLRTPGLVGSAQSLPPFSARTRSLDLSADALEAVLEAENVEAQETIEMLDVQPSDGTRDLGEPVIEVEVPERDEEAGQFLLYTDESGVTTWHFATPGAPVARGETPRRSYVIRRRVVVPEAQRPDTVPTGPRSLTAAIGKKLLKVLVFPLVDPIIGTVSDYFAERWEAKKRPYRIRTFAPESYHHPEAPDVDGEAWRHLTSGKALLFIHGTFSRAHSSFGELPRDYVEQLHRRYDGRVFAFDHFTLSHDPKKNVEWFLQQLPGDAALDLDIICHCRGGLVSRVLAEKQSAFSLGSRALRVGKVIFVATPNAGTTLADPEYMGDFVDTYTNLLNFIPDNPVADILEGVITVAKQLAVGALGGLDGLQSMRPGGTFQRWLNAGSRVEGVRYFALASNFEPTTVGFKDYVKDHLMDAVFRKDNDLVVPTAGVYEPNGAGCFPIDERHAFTAHEGVTHTTFFSHARAREQILQWLHA